MAGKPPNHADEPAQAAKPTAPSYETADLFRGLREIRIAHAGEIYRLRITASNKLILTK